MASRWLWSWQFSDSVQERFYLDSSQHTGQKHPLRAEIAVIEVDLFQQFIHAGIGL